VFPPGGFARVHITDGRARDDLRAMQSISSFARIVARLRVTDAKASFV
jgi:hypothetical protein